MASQVTVTVTDSQTEAVVTGVRVWITSDLAGETTLYEEYTSSAGIAVFSLDAGTYYCFARQAGKYFDNPETITVASAALAVAITCDPLAASDSGPTQICNEAIALVGPVAHNNQDYLDTYDGNPADPQAIPAMAWCQRLYPGEARDYCQAELEMPECQGWDVGGAALDDDDCETAPNWLYFYSRPTNCLLFQGIVYEINAITGKESTYPHAEIGNQIACDQDGEETDFYFKYVKRVTDTTRWSQGLRTAIVHRLAYLLARPLGQDAARQIELLSQYKEARYEAMCERGRRVFIPQQTGGSVEIVPGLVDYKFPINA